MKMGAIDMVWAWLLATLLFVVLVGSGRTMRGRLLGRPPFGAGLALSAALGVFFFSMIWMGLGHFGALRSPFPRLVLGLGVLLALPGLLWTWRDLQQPAPGLEPGFGPRWFAGGAWFLLIAALLISFFWISGVYDYGGVGFLFERAGIDYAVGRSFFDPGMPRTPFLGNEPLGLWTFGLGSPEASLALAWWLGVAILFGVCGLGWRLHHHGAGLAAAAVLSIVLFASDRPLFLAPALPSALAMIAVMVLAVESRGRPHLGRSVVAGVLGGFALVSDLGAGAMLLPLMIFGPSWCKKARLREPDSNGDTDEKKGWDDKGFEEGIKLLGLKKWLTPLRHTAYGLVGLSIPLLPWLARNEDWVGDPCYGFEEDFYIESDYRFMDFSRSELGFQSGFGQPGEGYGEQGDYPRIDNDRLAMRFGRQELVLGEGAPRINPRIQIDPIFLDYDVDFGPSFLDGNRFFDDYLDATEWGYGIGLAALFAPLVGQRRRERIVYIAPAIAGYVAGAYGSDFEAISPSALGLLSVSAGQALYDMKDCRPPIRSIAMGGALATGSLSLGLSVANDCDYWPTWGDYTQFPQFEFRYQEPPAEEEEKLEFTLGYTWKPTYGLSYELDPGGKGGTGEARDWSTDFRVKYGYDFRRGFRIQAEYQYEEDADAAPGTPMPGTQMAPETPRFEVVPEDEEDPKSRMRPKIPELKPNIRF